MNKLQSNCIWNPNMFIQENAIENIVCETAAILSRLSRIFLELVCWVSGRWVQKDAVSTDRHQTDTERDGRIQSHNSNHFLAWGMPIITQDINNHDTNYVCFKSFRLGDAYMRPLDQHWCRLWLGAEQKRAIAATNAEKLNHVEL